jgi:hypothetical protein
MENTSFDAESDAENGYMVAFDFSLIKVRFLKNRRNSVTDTIPSFFIGCSYAY